MPLPQVWPSKYHSELNLFCPLPPPCPIVQRPQTVRLFASAEWLPSVPPAGAWLSVTGLAVLRAGHGALWAGYMQTVNGRQQGALASARGPTGGRYSRCSSPNLLRSSSVHLYPSFLSPPPVTCQPLLLYSVCSSLCDPLICSFFLLSLEPPPSLCSLFYSLWVTLT